MKRTVVSIILPIIGVLVPTLHAQASRLDASEIEKLVFKRVNEERSRQGLSEYRHSSDLEKIAKQHSTNMITHDFFSHVDHKDMNVRLRKMLLCPHLFTWAIGENIACVFGGSEEEVAEKLVIWWMNSPGHRANILSEKFSYIGIGVEQKGDQLYATQVFGELVAKMVTELPDPVPYGSEQTLRFEFLSDFPKEQLSVLVNFPDKSARFYIRGRSYLEGFGIYEPHWDGEYFTVTVKFDKGQGTYDLTLGEGGKYFSGGIKISVM